MRNHLDHCLVEFTVANDIIVVFVDFTHDLIPNLLISIVEGRLTHRPMEHRPDLFLADHPIPVLVKQIEGNPEVLFVEEAGPIDSSRDELSIVNLAVMIRVQLSDKLMPVLGASPHKSQNCLHPFLQLINC